MKYGTDSWRYRVWKLAFWNLKTIPLCTTRRRYWLKVLFFPVGALCEAIGTLAMWLAFTIIGNMYTILTGTGVYVTWGKRWLWRTEDHIQEFSPLKIGESLIRTQGVAIIIWTCLVLGALWHWYPQPIVIHLALFVACAWLILKMFAVFFMVGAVSWLDEYLEDIEIEDQTRLERIYGECESEGKPLPPEVIVFVNPEYEATHPNVDASDDD